VADDGSGPARSGHEEPADDSAAAGGRLANDHMANERTYLAWLRTSLAIVVLGTALIRLNGTSDAPSLAAAIMTLAFGIGVLVYGTHRYYHVSRDLVAGRFRPARRGPIIVAVAAVLAVSAIVPLLVV
jgi:putative membrane protein